MRFSLLAAILAFKSVLAGEDPVMRTYLGSANQVYLEMSTTDNLTALNITAIFPRSSWVGLGFGPDMTSAELVMMLATDDESQLRIISTRTSKHSKPPLPAVNDSSYPLSWSHVNETHVRFSTLRKLDTGVENQEVVAVGTVVNMLWAFKLGGL